MTALSRLTRYIDLPDGLDPQEALCRANDSLESHRSSALKVIDQALAELVEGGNQASLETLARLSDSIGGLAGMFQMDALGQAAKRLCDIVRLFQLRGTSAPALIDLHIAALRLVRSHPDSAQATELLRGLDRIAAREAKGPGAATG
ncbi:Hpt domain-containing protein [Caulobacter henricii]|uniref:Uncharacterized protein n=1 Tax=Caulobacter henricii TaxID=69395 RepID=A0A0P0P316_9CAUL|nr:Hpt domain-containing protein [Caulobacter henricii]ALL14583.1 hypothetical protein AQ619_15175 [Caulobacter henricii]